MPVDNTTAWQKLGCNEQLSMGSGLTGVSQVISGLEPNTEYDFSAWANVNGQEQYTLSVTNASSSPNEVTGTNSEFVRRDIVFTTGLRDTTATISITKSSPGLGQVIAEDVGLVEAGP